MKNKKVVFIVGAIIFIICLITTICAVSFGMIFSNMFKQGQEIKSEIINEVCTTHQTLDSTKQKKWFSTRFNTNNDLKTTQQSLDSAFPSSFNCKSILPESFFAFISSGQSINISWRNNQMSAIITYPLEAGNQVTLELIKEGEVWKIDRISTTSYTF